MAGAPVVKVEGARKLRRELKAAGAQLADLKSVHDRVADLVTTEAQRRAPVRTGRLRASLKPISTSASAIVRATKAAVPYGAPVHWGWPRRNIRENAFAWEAAQDLQPQIERLYLQDMEAALAKVRGART